jgi:hypothetical protein
LPYDEPKFPSAEPIAHPNPHRSLRTPVACALGTTPAQLIAPMRAYVWQRSCSDHRHQHQHQHQHRHRHQQRHNQHNNNGDHAHASNKQTNKDKDKGPVRVGALGTRPEVRGKCLSFGAVSRVALNPSSQVKSSESYLRREAYKQPEVGRRIVVNLADKGHVGQHGRGVLEEGVPATSSGARAGEDGAAWPRRAGRRRTCHVIRGQGWLS